MNAGDYQGQAIEGTVQYGESDKGTLQIGIDMAVFEDDRKIGQMTTILYFSESAAVYSFERLRMLGWKGQGPQDIDKLGDIFNTKVPVRVTAPESYTAADGTQKMGSSKLEIVTGGGSLQFQKTVDPGAFAKRLAALSGTVTSSGGGGGGAEPPF